MDDSRLVPEPTSRVSSPQPPRTAQKGQVQQPTGSSLSILLLLLPLVGAVWAGRQEHHTVVDQGSALATAVCATLVVYAVMWLLSFWRTTKDSALLLITLFLLVVWLIVGVFVSLRLNTALDGGVGETFEAAVVGAELTGKGRKTRCILQLKSDIEHVAIDPEYCEIVEVGDAYVAALHPGALGMRWFGPPTIRKRSPA
jgi:hypothetical protein